MTTPEFWLGLVMGAIIASAVIFGVPWYKFTQEYRDEVEYEKWRKSHPPGQMGALSIGMKLDTTAWEEGMRRAGQQVKVLSSAFAKQSPYLPKGRWCPWWFHKRFHKKPIPVTKGVGGPKVGEVTEIKETEDGIWISGRIDRDTPEGQATWEAIAGPPGAYSVGEENATDQVLHSDTDPERQGLSE